MISNKKIFITGGAGFIGSSLIARLIEDNSIVVYDNLQRNALKSRSYAGHPNLTLIQGDVLDFELLEKSMAGANIVIHAAAVAGIDNTLKNPVNTLRINMLGTANVLEAARGLSGLERLLDFSTSEVFGEYAYKSAETTNTVTGAVGEARWTYAVSKLAGEHLTHAYYSFYGLPAVTVRPFNIYGPEQVGEGAIHIFIRKALLNEDIFIFGDGSQIRAWCYIDDMVDALIACLEKPGAVGESFNVGNPRAITTIYGLAEIVCRILGSQSKIVFKSPLSADIELRIPKVDKMREYLGISAKVDLEEGIRRTAAWYREHLEALSKLPDIFNK